MTDEEYKILSDNLKADMNKTHGGMYWEQALSHFFKRAYEMGRASVFQEQECKCSSCIAKRINESHAKIGEDKITVRS